MRIIIVGSGKLGYSIAELLAKEEIYDVVVIDKDPKSLAPIRDNLDVLTLSLNGSSPITMADPEIKGADVLIAVTNSDEINMVACVLAKKSGIKSTVARVRDIEFISDSKEYLKENFDIDLMLNPEQLTAVEISRILMMPHALNVEDFAGGKIRLFETRVKENSRFLGKDLMELDIPKNILVAMIFRAGQIIIPHGRDQLMPLDNVYFVGDPENIENFSKNLAEVEIEEIKKVLIIGASRTGRLLAYALDRMGVSVKVMDKDRAICRELDARLTNSTVICADGTNIDVLEEEGVREADAVACLTKDDNLNLLMALFWKHIGTKKTIVQVTRETYIELMEKVGVDIVLSPRLLAANLVLSTVRRGGGVVSVSLLEGAKAEAVELVVHPAAKIAGKKLMDAKLPKGCLVCGVLSNGAAFIPNGHTVLNAGDQVIVLLRKDASKEIIPLFNPE